MKYSIATIAFALALAGCSANPDDGQDRIYADEVLDDDGSEGDSPSTIAGVWHVAAIDGEPFEAPVALALVAGDQIAEWGRDCRNLMNRYWIDGTDFNAERLRYFVPVGMSPVDAIPPPCLPGLPPGLERSMTALDRAERIEWRSKEEIVLSGDERSITLLKQADVSQ